MNPSSIEWTDTTWNPVTGCSKVSQGCKNCYAERMFARPYPGRDFTDVRTHTDRLAPALRMRKPRRIFVNSMSDLFHEAVPRDFIDAVWSTMAEARHHIFQILTKRPERMRAFMIDRKNKGWKADWRNIWLGVSVEDQATADERIPLLLQTPAAVRFISAEPLLGPIDIHHRIGHCVFTQADPYSTGRGLDLVIAGGESGPHARPSHPDWFRSLRDQCAATGTSFFFKQWGEWAPNCLCDTACAHPEIKRPEPGKMGVMFRCGKKAARRLLDEREHSELPKETT
jgi:protein gp37